VGFRRKHPDEETVKLVIKELQDNINVSQLVDWPADH
jgi:hypothetical protein